MEQMAFASQPLADLESQVRWLACAMACTAIVTFIALFFIKAPYGRYGEGSSPIFGPMINGQLAWVLQESPSLLMGVYWLVRIRPQQRQSLVNWALIAMFMGHYANRSLVYPFKMRGAKPTPLLVFLMAAIFCTYNGYMQMAYLTQLAVYPDGYVTDWRFLIGSAIFLTGMGINIQSDSILRNLRRPGETAHRIPRGGAFEYVTSANYLGEIVEWTGFAVASWSLPGFAFALFTAANLVPRARDHDQWCRAKFKDDYPKERKILVPLVW